MHNNRKKPSIIQRKSFENFKNTW
uniref:Uncharacterized protein n=1 Tax=Heterorhabditis bacteriophora TaxID=37862 RepID=A0A1I7WR40_HETBA